MKNKLIVLSALMASLFALTAHAAPDCVGVKAPFFQKAKDIKWVWNPALKAEENMVCGDATTPGLSLIHISEPTRPY